MSLPNVTQGYETILSYGNMPTASGSTAWTDFAGILDIKPPKVESEDIDVSNMTSPNQFKQFVAGWAMGGEIECKIQFEKSQNATVYGLFRQNKGFKITFSDGSTWTADGYLKTFSNEVDREKIVTADVQVKVSGQPQFNAAS
jgi:hypothetical protein